MKTSEITRIKPMFDLINPQANVIRAFASECLSSKYRQRRLSWKNIERCFHRCSNHTKRSRIAFRRRINWNSEREVLLNVRDGRDGWKTRLLGENEKEKSEKSDAEECKQKLSHATTAALQPRDGSKRTAFSHVFVAALSGAVCRRMDFSIVLQLKSLLVAGETWKNFVPKNNKKSVVKSCGSTKSRFEGQKKTFNFPFPRLGLLRRSVVSCFNFSCVNLLKSRKFLFKCCKHHVKNRKIFRVRRETWLQVVNHEWKLYQHLRNSR